MTATLEDYRPLAREFSHDQHAFFMLARQGDVALFAKRKHGRWSYEVVIVQKHDPARCPSGTSLPAREATPHNEQWGTYGWTPYDWKAAWEKFEAKCAEHAEGLDRWQRDELPTYCNES
jgi:hypothetical protein